MDYEKYYKKDYEGFYHLHFLNKDRLNQSEIRNIFSLYGKVIRVNFSKDETGYTFVQYKSLQETVCCLDGLRDGSKIQLLPERSKMNSLNKKIIKRDSNQQQESRMENLFRKTFNSDEQLNLNSTYNKNLPNSRENLTRIRPNEYNGFNNVLDIDYQNFTHKPNLNVMRDNESDLSIFNGKSSLSSRQQTSMENFSQNSSDSTMDYEKYYRISKDAYTVHFVNKKEHSLEQITELFSPYGNISSIYSGGDNNRLRFVTYRTLEEVIKCLKGLKNSSIISILPQKDKMGETKTADQRNSNQRQAARIEDTLQRTFSTDKQFNSNFIHSENSTENRKWSNHNTKICDLDKFKDIDYRSDTVSHSSKQSCKFNENEIRYKNTSPQMFNEKYSFLKQQDPTNNEGYSHVIRETQQKTKLYPSKIETNTEIDRDMGISTCNYKIPALISNTETKSNESDVMSDSLSLNGTRNSSSKIVIPMQEIIVANIHTNYGIHYILHLFEKHDPISATLVKTIPENGIRYCHVYFKTVQDAVAVEEEFDNFDLYGKNLIVLRKSRLVDETICK